jgi:hypothetical protein
MFFYFQFYHQTTPGMSVKYKEALVFPGAFCDGRNLFLTYNFYALLRNLANTRKAISSAK